MKPLSSESTVEDLLKYAAKCTTKEEADEFIYYKFEPLFKKTGFGLFLSTNHDVSIDEDGLFCAFEFNHVISSDFITSIKPIIENGKFGILISTNIMNDGLGMGSQDWDVYHDMESYFLGNPEETIEEVSEKAKNEMNGNWEKILMSAGLTHSQAVIFVENANKSTAS